MNRVFSEIPASRMLALLIGVGEVISIIVRRHNAGVLNDEDFTNALAQLFVQVVDSPKFRSISVPDELVHRSFRFIAQHSLNATDAIVLASPLETARALRDAGDDLVLVASDARLITAARTEGLSTFNPETGSEGDLLRVTA